MKRKIFVIFVLTLTTAISDAAKKPPTERQAANVFRAYDKNSDGAVTPEEWLMMRHMQPNDRSSRAQLERSRFQQAGPGKDGRFNQKEFVYWYTTGRFKNVREGGAGGPGDEAGAVRRGPRDGEGAARPGPRDGEGVMRRGARDGEGAPKSGPRDGEGAVRRGPRDGEGARRGAADGEGRPSAEGEGRPSAEGSGGVTLNVDTSGNLLANGRRMNSKQRVDYLRGVAKQASGKKVYIRASRGTSMSGLQALIRECQNAGIKNLFLSPQGR